MSNESIPPPPPYEVSQHEFDQKILQAVEISQSSLPVHDDGGWEAWDEAAFQAAAARQPESAGPSSTEPTIPSKWDYDVSASVAPLRVVKKTSPGGCEQLPKERPSWLVKDVEGLSSSLSSAALSGRSRDYSDQNPVVHDIPSEDEERPNIAPPPFTPVGPSLDGPPFDEVVMAYHGNGSAPPSPLLSPRSIHSPLPVPPHNECALSQIHMQPARRSLPSPRQALNRTGCHPATGFMPPTKTAQSTMGPRMEFDPLVAYSIESRLENVRPVPQRTQVFDAKSFYNSAVSAHLPSMSSKPTTYPSRPHPMHIPAHDYPNSSLYPGHHTGEFPLPDPGMSSSPQFPYAGHSRLQQAPVPGVTRGQYLISYDDARDNRVSRTNRWTSEQSVARDSFYGA